MKRILHLSVKKIYFQQIKDKSKVYEYRLQTDYWRKRLMGKTYDEIYIKLGYPGCEELDRIEVRPWKGFVECTVNHEHFGSKDVSVFAIVVN